MVYNPPTPEEVRRAASEVQNKFQLFRGDLESEVMYDDLRNSFVAPVLAGDRVASAVLADLVEGTLRDPRVPGVNKYRAIHLLKEAMDKTGTNLGGYVGEKHIENLGKMIMAAKSTKGETLFTQNPNPEDKAYGARCFKLLLNCVQAWSETYTEFPPFMEVLTMLFMNEVNFPDDLIEFNTKLGGSAKKPPAVTTSSSAATGTNQGGNSSPAEKQAADSLKMIRELITDMILNNDKFEDFFSDSIKDYEHTYKQSLPSVGAVSSLSPSSPALRELLFAEDFINVFNNEFSPAKITFDQFKQQMKNGIENRVQAKIKNHGGGAGNHNEVARPSNPPGLPSNLPFGAPPILQSGGPNPSQPFHGGDTTPHFSNLSTPQGQLTTMAISQQPQPPMPLLHSTPQNDSLIHDLRSEIEVLKQRLAGTEGQLQLSKNLTQDLKSVNEEQRVLIDQLRQERQKLELQLDGERKRAEDAIKSALHSSGNNEAVKMLKEKIRDLEGECQQLNNENNRLFELVKHPPVQQVPVPPPQPPPQPHHVSPPPDSHPPTDFATIQLLNQLQDRVHHLEAENKLLKRDNDKLMPCDNIDFERLQSEYKKLKEESVREIKELKNRVLIAEEKAKNMLKDYRDSLNDTTIIDNYSNYKPTSSHNKERFSDEFNRKYRNLGQPWQQSSDDPSTTVYRSIDRAEEYLAKLSKPLETSVSYNHKPIDTSELRRRADSPILTSKIHEILKSPNMSGFNEASTMVRPLDSNLIRSPIAVAPVSLPTHVRQRSISPILPKVEQVPTHNIFSQKLISPLPQQPQVGAASLYLPRPTLPNPSFDYQPLTPGAASFITSPKASSMIASQFKPSLLQQQQGYQSELSRPSYSKYGNLALPKDAPAFKSQERLVMGVLPSHNVAEYPKGSLKSQREFRSDYGATPPPESRDYGVDGSRKLAYSYQQPQHPQQNLDFRGEAGDKGLRRREAVANKDKSKSPKDFLQEFHKKIAGLDISNN